MSKDKASNTQEQKMRKMFEGINAVEGFSPKALAYEIPAPEGSDLAPTLNIAVKDRISWFRLKYPKGKIISEIHSYQNGYAIMKASITDEEGNVLATATGTATYREEDGFGRNPIECAETKAIGRALSFAGFGTQFSTDAELPKDTPIDMGVPVPTEPANATPDDNLNDIFAPAVDKRAEFEEKVEKFKKNISPEDSKKMVITYGNMATLTFSDAYRKSPADNKLGIIEKYAYPTEEELTTAQPMIVASARVFLESATKK